jgi:hypothetical protein
MITTPLDLEDDDDFRSPDRAAKVAAGVTVPARASWLTRTANVWVPCLILVLLAAPCVTFMIPATQDYVDEIYQPLQALKFFKSHGHAFHKYGPMPNFILAPGYAASIAYWKITGSFSKPSETFPYGFARPFEQMGFLIFQGRLLFLILGVIALAYLGHTLRLVTENKFAIAFALLFCFATNYAVAEQLPSPRPDSPMLAFSALAIAMYLRMLYLGLTVRRGVAFSLFAVFAISSKELAGPLFVLPYLGLIWLAWRRGVSGGADQPGGRRGAERTIRYSFLAGVIAYAMLNIVYAPATWLQRMKFWLVGPGINAEVWGKGGLGSRVVGIIGCLFDNFGPGGAIVVAVALIAFIFSKRRKATSDTPNAVMLALPALSVAVLGLAKLQYPADRFYTILSLALIPVVAKGLDTLFVRSQATHFSGRGLERTLIGSLCVLAALNIWFATFSWHALRGTFEYVAEKHIVAHVDKAQTISLFNTYPWNPGSTRLDELGYHHDSRSIQQIAASRSNPPDWIYATNGKLQFLQDARALPARAEMVRKESGFDVATWAGVEGLGYQLDQTVVPQTPAWFPFDWMPAVKEWKQRRQVLIYRRS